MPKLEPEDYIINKYSSRALDSYQYLFFDIQTTNDDKPKMKHCLFNDRSVLTNLTSQAYHLIVEYFKSIESGRLTSNHLINAIENKTLFVAVRQPEDGGLIFVTSFDKNPDVDNQDLYWFIHQLNNYAQRVSNKKNESIQSKQI